MTRRGRKPNQFFGMTKDKYQLYLSTCSSRTRADRATHSLTRESHDLTRAPPSITQLEMCSAKVSSAEAEDAEGGTDGGRGDAICTHCTTAYKASAPPSIPLLVNPCLSLSLTAASGSNLTTRNDRKYLIHAQCRQESRLQSTITIVRHFAAFKS